MNTPLQKSHLVVSNSDLDIYIIAFNKPSLIEDQIQLLKKNLKDNYRLIIIDNSNKTEESQKIENICRNNNTSYFKLPENKLTASHSHALALNYTMKNIISNQNTPYIGFLDHDCFLVKGFSIIPILKQQKLWGHLMDNIQFKWLGHTFNMSGKRRNLWPGCAFYNKQLFNQGFDFFPNKKIFPLSFLDTGGGNYAYIYKFYDHQKLSLLKSAPNKILKGTENIGKLFVHLGGAGYRDSNIIKNIEKQFSTKYF